MKNLNGFRELQIEDTRNVADGAQHATLMNVTGASGSPYSSGESQNSGQGMPTPIPPFNPNALPQTNLTGDWSRDRWIILNIQAVEEYFRNNPGSTESNHNFWANHPIK